jgi:hypothetical protein
MHAIQPRFDPVSAVCRGQERGIYARCRRGFTDVFSDSALGIKDLR